MDKYDVLARQINALLFVVAVSQKRRCACYSVGLEMKTYFGAGRRRRVNMRHGMSAPREKQHGGGADDGGQFLNPICHLPTPLLAL
jgi:hypothetical protein